MKSFEKVDFVFTYFSCIEFYLLSTLTFLLELSTIRGHSSRLTNRLFSYLCQASLLVFVLR